LTRQKVLVVQRAVGQWGEVEGDDRSCVLVMNVDSLEWPVMVLAQLGAPFSDVEPAGLRDEITRVAGQFTAAL
jgi:hypothetical protein